MKRDSTDYQIPIEIDDLQIIYFNGDFELESGAVLNGIHIGFHTYGKLNAAKDNVIWVCHALTANSHVADWWKGCFGKGKMIDSEKYFVVCANILGSCYGTTGARSINPKTGTPYGLNFPFISIRDIVNAHNLLARYLDINNIQYCIGGSCGGHQVLEFAFLRPDFIKKSVLLVTSAKETPWVIAAHESQRMALESDSTWNQNIDKAASKGLRSARAMALLLYRTFESYCTRQEDIDGKVDDFKASSYIQYQGKKLERRFYAHNYWYLLKALDTHHIGRGRGGTENALSKLPQPTLIISMDSDLLIPPYEQQKLAQHIPNAQHTTIKTAFGHDGFLIETQAINDIFQQWTTRF